MASKYMLCSFKTCPWVQRAAIVLQAKQIAYDITHIDRNQRPDWFAAVSPHGKVPVLVIDGKDALFESNAIVEYLDEILPPRLHPEDPILRARNRAHSHACTKTQTQTNNTAQSVGARRNQRCAVPAQQPLRAHPSSSRSRHRNQ